MIKEVEAFYDFHRGTRCGCGGAAVAFEEWLEAPEDAILEDIRAYNEDDCRSLYELHQWLLGLRPAEAKWRQPVEERELKEEAKERLEERARVEAELLAWAQEGEPRWLLAHLLEYHRREEKPQWWAYFEQPLEAGPKKETHRVAEAIAGLELVGNPEPDNTVTHLHAQLPASGAQDRWAARDPVTQKSYAVRIVSEDRGLVTLRRSKKRVERVPTPGR